MRSTFRRWVSLAVLALAPLAHAVAGTPAFGDGVHDTLADRVYAAQDVEYRRVVAELDAYLQRNPSDSVAAVERCRFIDVFAYAEDNENEQASADSEACHDALKTGPLAASPAAKLFAWEDEWGDDAIAAGEALLADSASWNRQQLVALHESLATRYRNQDIIKAGEHALIAVNLDANSHSRQQAAEHLVRIGARARAVAMLQGTPAARWQAWTLRQAVGTLIDMGEARIAAELVRAHADIALDAAIRARLASALLDAGDAEQAQALMKALTGEDQSDLSGKAMDREVFEFQRDHGTTAEAVAAYRKLRDRGYEADPFGHARLTLLLRHPKAPWQADELLGVGALLLMFLVLALLPLVVIIPLHHWSLYRRVSGKTVETIAPAWHLGHLWYALGVVCIAGGIATYVFSYEQFANIVGFDTRPGHIADERALGRAYVCMQVLTLIALLPLMLRAGLKQRVLGQWSFGQSAAAGIGVSFLVLMAAGVFHTLAKPGLALGGDTIRSMQGIYALYGTLGLLLATSVAAPLLEEFVFRGVFLQVAARHAPFWIAAALQAGIFVALHDQAGAIPFLIVLALAAAWLARKSGGLVAPMALHVTNNLMASLAIMGVTRSVNAVP